jgi:hypothetical protein
VTPDERERARATLAAAEHQQRQADNFAWTVVPVVAIAGQAFLFQIALAENVSPANRVYVAVAGLAILAGAAHLMIKQVFNFDMYEAVAERERVRLELPRMTRDYLLEDFESFDKDTSLRRREWWWKEPIRGQGTRHQLQASFARMVVKQKAVRVWLIVLAVLAVLDLIILLDAVYDRFGDTGLIVFGLIAFVSLGLSVPLLTDRLAGKPRD